MKRFLAILALFGLGLQARDSGAQSGSTTQATTTYGLYKYNLNSLSEIYCGLGAEQVVSAGRVASAASTTYTASSGSPYTDVSVGDYITGQDLPANGSDLYQKGVVARASAVSITVNNAVSVSGWPAETTPTLTDASIKLRKVTCGTGNDTGAIPVSTARSINLTFGISQIDVVGGIDVRLLCRTAGSAPWVQVYPELTPPALGPTYVNYTTAAQLSVSSTTVWTHCRWGMLIHTADDGVDTGVAAEQIVIWTTQRP